MSEKLFDKYYDTGEGTKENKKEITEKKLKTSFKAYCNNAEEMIIDFDESKEQEYIKLAEGNKDAIGTLVKLRARAKTAKESLDGAKALYEEFFGEELVY